MTRHFRSLSSFTVDGKVMKVVALDREEPREGLLRSLQGDDLFVDGVRVRVEAVESHAVPTLRKGARIALRLAP